MDKTISDYPDYWYRLIYWLTPVTNTFNFELWRITALGESAEEMEIDETADATGYVKWDGCMNIQTNGYQHFCNSKMAMQYGVMLQEVFRLARINGCDVVFGMAGAQGKAEVR